MPPSLSPGAEDVDWLWLKEGRKEERGGWMDQFLTFADGKVFFPPSLSLLAFPIFFVQFPPPPFSPFSYPLSSKNVEKKYSKWFPKRFFFSSPFFHAFSLFCGGLLLDRNLPPGHFSRKSASFFDCPTTNGGMQNGSSVWIFCTHCIHVFARLVLICMLSWWLLTKFLHWSSGGSLLRVRCWLGKEKKKLLISVFQVEEGFLWKEKAVYTSNTSGHFCSRERGGEAFGILVHSFPSSCLLPNQQRTVNKLPPELQCRKFVNNHRLSIQIGAKRAKTCMQWYIFQLSFPFAYHRWWLGTKLPT